MIEQFGWDLVKVLSGALVAGGGAYLLLARDVAFIKGQLTQLVKMMTIAEKNGEKIGEMKELMHKHQKDMNHFFERLRDLEDPPLSQQ